MEHLLRCHEIVPINLTDGSNCSLVDPQGRQYTDFEAGIWSTALGHCHPRINQVIHEQVERISHLGTRYPNALAEQAAAAILRIVGMPDGKCTFLSSGSEAVEFGVQAVRRLTEKPLLLTLADSYLAAYGSAGRKISQEWHLFDWSHCPSCLPRKECDLQCSRLAEVPFSKIGGFVFEPGNASGTVKCPPAQLVQILARTIQPQGGLLMANEVTTGMGRTGAWFGFEHYALRPDLVALGKGLGNGYPVSAVAFRLNVAQRLEESGLRYAQSHQNDPLGCAVALEVIRVLEEERLVERSRRIGIIFLEELKRLSERHQSILEARGRGLMLALEFQRDPEQITATNVQAELLTRGFLVGTKPGDNLLRFYPALTILEEDISRLVQTLDQILTAMEARS